MKVQRIINPLLPFIKCSLTLPYIQTKEHIEGLIKGFIIILNCYRGLSVAIRTTTQNFWIKILFKHFYMILNSIKLTQTFYNYICLYRRWWSWYHYLHDLFLTHWPLTHFICNHLPVHWSWTVKYFYMN